MSTTTTIAPSRAITAENVLRLFPEINTSVIGAQAQASATQDADMQGYDEEQIRLMDEMCIVLDDDDLPIGSGSKKLCTYGKKLKVFRTLRARCGCSLRLSTRHSKNKGGNTGSLASETIPFVRVCFC